MTTMMKKIRFSLFCATLALSLAFVAGCSDTDATSDASETGPGVAEAKTVDTAHWADALEPMGVKEVEALIDAGKGRPVLVCFWSVNCPACVQELPVLEELADQYGKGELTVLLFNLDQDRALLKTFFQDYVPASRVVLAEPQVGEAFRAVYIPKLMLYDASGALAFEGSGFYPKAMLEALIKKAQ
ncbi:MAG: TlpA disulfide reductase family protein [Desulfovibrionaceae bacterium]